MWQCLTFMLLSSWHSKLNCECLFLCVTNTICNILRQPQILLCHVSLLCCYVYCIWNCHLLLDCSECHTFFTTKPPLSFLGGGGGRVSTQASQPWSLLNYFGCCFERCRLSAPEHHWTSVGLLATSLEWKWRNALVPTRRDVVEPCCSSQNLVPGQSTSLTSAVSTWLVYK